MYVSAPWLEIPPHFALGGILAFTSVSLPTNEEYSQRASAYRQLLGSRIPSTRKFDQKAATKLK